MKIISEQLRLAKEEDKDLLLEWANDSLVRKNSFKSNQIEKDEHEKWFHRLMESSNEYIYIYVVNDCEAGYVRITLVENTAEIHYSICSAMRNNGLAKRMLNLLIEELQRNYPQIVNVIARVKSNNEISKHVLQSLGYENLIIQVIDDTL